MVAKYKDIRRNAGWTWYNEKDFRKNPRNMTYGRTPYSTERKIFVNCIN